MRHKYWDPLLGKMTNLLSLDEAGIFMLLGIMGLGKMTVFSQRLLTVMIYWTRHSFITSVAMKTYIAGSVILEFSQREPFLQKLVLCWPWTSLQIQGGESVLLGHLLVVGGINPFRKFWLLFSNPLPKFCVQLHLPPSTNEWTWWRSLRMQVAKTGTIAKALFKSERRQLYTDWLLGWFP